MNVIWYHFYYLQSIGAGCISFKGILGLDNGTVPGVLAGIWLHNNPDTILCLPSTIVFPSILTGGAILPLSINAVYLATAGMETLFL